MLGFAEFWAFMAYLCTLLAALFCVVYGISNWNKPQADQTKEIDAEMKWKEKDAEIMK